MKKAIAYVSDVILGTTGEVISRADQKKKIEAYAAENGIEVAAWYEDAIYAESLADRPGLKALLADGNGATVMLVERVWCLSRNWKELRDVMGRLETKAARLESATTLWDCVSQMARHHYTTGGLKPREGRVVEVEEATEAVRVRKPARLHFLGVKRSVTA